ncbi:hypothetical protein J3E68DRAFT_415547 [Trichoderma sp. SZMC 28012]
MADEKNHPEFVYYVDSASSTEGCPTPSTTMSEDMPIRERKQHTRTLKDRENVSYSKPDKTKERGKYDKDINKARETKSPNNDNAKTEEIKPTRDDDHVSHIEQHPIPGKVFIMRTRQQPYRFLGLEYGHLELLDNPAPNRGVFWYCNENSGWYSLCNTASGTYLGHNGAGNIVAAKNIHKAEQYIIPLRQDGGGYVLHTFHPEKAELWQVAIAERGVGRCLVETRIGGVTWDFIDAEYVRYSMSVAYPGREKESLFPD